jgi:cysteine desulfurase/selenocysteine lyase
MLKSQFPIFQNNPGLIYFDNGATTQKPQSVIDAEVEFYSKYNSNVHRGLYPLSQKATDMYEEARHVAAEFINASPEEIIFTNGTTDSTNAIATMLQKSKLLNPKPKILLTELEHHANIIPWQQLENSEIDWITLDENYQLKKDYSDFYVNPTTFYDLVSTTLVSNVTGTILPVQEINKTANRSYTLVDAAQAVAHIPIDVKALDVDFLVFSGHKMFGPTGIGVLYAKKELLEKFVPFRTGGGMIVEVGRNSATWAEIPERFEAGTPNIAGAVGLGEAIKFINNIGFDYIQSIENELRNYLFTKLSDIPNIKIFHPSLDKSAASVISFYIDGVHPHDISEFLGNSNICVRAGHHCTHILHREVFKVPATVRASLSIYNTKEEIDVFVEKLKEVVKIYKK